MIGCENTQPPCPNRRHMAISTYYSICIFQSDGGVTRVSHRYGHIRSRCFAGEFAGRMPADLESWLRVCLSGRLDARAVADPGQPATPCFGLHEIFSQADVSPVAVATILACKGRSARICDDPVGFATYHRRMCIIRDSPGDGGLSGVAAID